MAAFNLFKKEDKKTKKPAVKKPEASVAPVQKPEHAPILTGVMVLKNFRVSEKSARLLELNQYTFNVSGKASKGEVKKQIEKMYSVKVAKVRVQNLPAKTRTVGRHVGTRPGFRKAIITLADGYTIDAFKQ